MTRDKGPSRGDLERLRREEQKLRTQRIDLLKARLTRLRAEVREVEAELRRAGVGGKEIGAGRTNWPQVLDGLPSTFSVAELQGATGASANLMSSVLHRWQASARVERVGRGKYRKIRWRSVPS